MRTKLSEAVRPVVEVEVTLSAAPGARVSWVGPEDKDEAIRAIVDLCGKVFEQEMDGRIEGVRQSDFNHHGMTVTMTIGASETAAVAETVRHHLSSIERTLETRLQVHFGWEHAAVSVRVDPHPAYQVRPEMPSSGGDVVVYQPGGGIAAPPVIVMPSPKPIPAQYDPIHTLPYPPRRSNALSGLLGAFIAISFAILVVVGVGPLVETINGLHQDQIDSALYNDAEIRRRDDHIYQLQQENVRLQSTVLALSSRRGHPAVRSDQPPRALSDTIEPAPDDIRPVADASPAAQATGVVAVAQTE